MGCGADAFTTGDAASDGSPVGDASTMDGLADAPADVRLDGPAGCQWCPQMSPTNHDLFGVSGKSQSEVAVVGTGAAAWWNGNTWATLPVTGVVGAMNLKSVSVLDAMNVWTVGTDNNGGLLLVGSNTSLGLPSAMLNPKAPAYNCVVRNSGIGMLGGSSGTSAFAWAPNSAWQYGDATAMYFGIDAEGPMNGIAVGNGKIATFNGNVWTEMPQGGMHFAVSGNANGGWIVGAGGEIIRYNMGMFSTIQSMTNQDLRGVYARYPSGDVWAVGKQGTIVFIKAGTAPAVIQPSGTTQDLNAIWGDANGLWAVGAMGTILRHP